MQEVIEQFRELFTAWQRAGYRLYLVGGCVRDAVMGNDRIGDIDFATDAKPENTAAVLEANGFKVIPIGARFGTIATFVGRVQVEITTFRVAEHYEATSRKPRVEFGKNIVDDLSRRDLSMNAMAAGADGEILDPFNGRGAIERRELEVPGGGLENTISILNDDPLRLLRIGRFAARFAFTPTEDTTEAAKLAAPNLEHISCERWKMELDKLLIADFVGTGLHWLREVGALQVIIPELINVVEAGGFDELVRRIEASERDVMVRWALIVFTTERFRDPVAAGRRPREAAGIRAAERIARRFRFSNAERITLRVLCGVDRRPEDLAGEWTKVRRRQWIFDFGEHLDRVVQFLAALGDDDPTAIAAASLAELHTERNEEDPTPNIPAGFGNRLIAHFDLPRGPLISAAIACLQKALVAARLPNDGDIDAYLKFLAEVETEWRTE